MSGRVALDPNFSCFMSTFWRTDGSQSTWLLKRTISVKDKEKNVQVEFEKDAPLNLALSASGVGKGLRRPGDGADQEGQELRWNYVRLKSATPPQEGISAGQARQQIWRLPDTMRSSRSLTDEDKRLLHFPPPAVQMRSLENLPLECHILKDGLTAETETDIWLLRVAALVTTRFNLVRLLFKTLV